MTVERWVMRFACFQSQTMSHFGGPLDEISIQIRPVQQQDVLLPSISDLDELSRIRTLLEYALEGGTYAYLKDLLQSMSEAIPGSHPNCYLRFGRQL